MTSCKHSSLVLLPAKPDVLRCEKCHLKISPDELGNSYCPECFEMHGTKCYDFEEIAAEETGAVKYRCEECGIVIESDVQENPD